MIVEYVTSESFRNARQTAKYAGDEQKQVLWDIKFIAVTILPWEPSA